MKLYYSISLLSLLFLVSACKVNYNLTGGSIEQNIKTISIANFNNVSGNGPANISLQFNEKLKNFYQNNTKLTVVNNEGDWQLDGKITKYFIQPMAPKANETVGLTRLTITVNATFVDQKNNRTFTKDFSFFDDVSQSESLSSVEQDKVNYILDQIVYMIFSETTSNW
jgi:hypothetical protein